ncbi:MAG: ribonuclease III [Lachnospiraceae bacterium]|nr:ribonuclease III [Lachnospiraceae bacterium]
MNNFDIGKLENAIGCKFNDKTLLKKAVTHSSFANERSHNMLDCNERLEFLGDAVLELCVSEFLFEKYPSRPEGELTKLRSQLVCEQSLAISAREIKLGDHLLLSKGEDQTGGRKRDSILSDAFEAVIGAIYLDLGREEANAFITRNVLNDVESRQAIIDAKSILQEMVQEKKQSLTYAVVDESGPDHDKTFTVKAVVNGEDVGYGKGPSKKRAEQEAAYNAIRNIKNV